MWPSVQRRSEALVARRKSLSTFKISIRETNDFRSADLKSARPERRVKYGDICDGAKRGRREKTRRKGTRLKSRKQGADTFKQSRASRDTRAGEPIISVGSFSESPSPFVFWEQTVRTCRSCSRSADRHLRMSDTPCKGLPTVSEVTGAKLARTGGKALRYLLPF